MFGKEENSKLRYQLIEKQEKINNLDARLESAKRDIKNIQLENKDLVERYEAKILKAKERIEVLEGLHDKSTELQVKELKLEQEEKLLQQRTLNADILVEEVKKAEEKGEQRAQKQYESGYADGLADGLRKVHEITAEDRKQAHQIAAMAVSTATVNKEIATAVAKDMKSLPSGTTRKK